MHFGRKTLALSFVFWFPAQYGGSKMLNAVPFINRMSIVFFASLALAVLISLAKPARSENNLITMEGVSFRTTTGFNVAAAIIVAILVALYWTWW